MSFDGYDGGGGGYGGGSGYLNTSTNARSPDEKKGGREQSHQTVTPLTFKMILDSNQNPADDTLNVDGKQISKVVAYGKILQAVSKQTFLEYLVDDGTGIMKVMKFDDDEVKSSEDILPDGIYVNINGSIRTVDGERTIQAHFIRPVNDFNELTCHFLSVIFTHYSNVKGPLNDGSKFTAGSGGGGFTTSAYGGTGGGMFGGGGGSIGFNGLATSYDNSAGIDSDSRLVHDAFAADQSSDSGYSIQFVADKLKSKGFTIQKVKTICENLMTEGFYILQSMTITSNLQVQSCKYSTPLFD